MLRLYAMEICPEFELFHCELPGDYYRWGKGERGRHFSDLLTGHFRKPMEVSYSRGGRPILEPLIPFSLSHKEHDCLLMIGTGGGGRLGVDIEHVPAGNAFLDAFFDGSERTGLLLQEGSHTWPLDALRTALFSAKESVFKCLSETERNPFQALIPQQITPGGIRWSVAAAAGKWPGQLSIHTLKVSSWLVSTAVWSPHPSEPRCSEREG